MFGVINSVILIFVLAILVAKLEGNVEGPHPWARNLPTKRYKNWLTDLIFDGKEITGYHFWLFSILFLIFHYHFILGASWSLRNELHVLGTFTFFIVLEDFLSIILNPYFGLRKFSSKHITWHKHWIGLIPVSYILGLSFSGVLLFISRWL